MMGISAIVQSRGGDCRTSRYTGPNAVRSSSFEAMGSDILVYLGVS